MSDWVGIAEAARRLNVSDDTIRRHIKKGKLNAQMTNGVWMIEFPNPENVAADAYAEVSAVTEEVADEAYARAEEVHMESEALQKAMDEIEWLKARIEKLETRLTEADDSRKRADAMLMQALAQMPKQIEDTQARKKSPRIWWPWSNNIVK